MDRVADYAERDGGPLVDWLVNLAGKWLNRGP
jgi:hypothetical protein